MAPQDTFKSLVADLKRSMKQLGYFPCRNRMFTRQYENWGVLELQKSMLSNREEVRFTINVGVCSSALVNFFGITVDARCPHSSQCHWRQRLGHLLEENQDKWWTIRSNTDSSALFEEIYRNLIDVAVTEIDRHIRDNDLIDMWMSNVSPGLSNFQRLLYLSVLLKENGSPRLKDIYAELRQQTAGTEWEGSAIRLLRMLESWRPDQ